MARRRRLRGARLNRRRGHRTDGHADEAHWWQTVIFRILAVLDSRVRQQEFTMRNANPWQAAVAAGVLLLAVACHGFALRMVNSCCR
ncbi:hypothetical protein EST92_31020, partial [Streptomyces sp. TM32]